MLKSLISHVVNFKSWIKLIYDKITYIHCITNEFNPTFEVQNMGNKAFQNASFWNALLPIGNEGYSCLRAMSVVIAIFFIVVDKTRHLTSNCLIWPFLVLEPLWHWPDVVHPSCIGRSATPPQRRRHSTNYGSDCLQILLRVGIPLIYCSPL